MRILFVAILLVCNSISASDSDYDTVVGSVPAGSIVVIEDFTRQAGGVFKGYNLKFDGEGDFYFRTVHLAKALDVEPATLLKKGAKLKGKKLKLKKDLSFVDGGVFMEEVEYTLKK